MLKMGNSCQIWEKIKLSKAENYKIEILGYLVLKQPTSHIAIVPAASLYYKFVGTTGYDN